MRSSIAWNSWIRSQRIAWFERRNLSFALLVAVTMLWFWDSLVLVFISSLQDGSSQQYSHISLIPVLCLYLLYSGRAAIFASTGWSPFLGTILMVAGVAVSLGTKGPTSDTLAELSPTIFSFVVVCWGAFLLCYGPHAFRAAFFALGLMAFMVPFPSVMLNAIVGFLQGSSADTVEVLFSTLGIPVAREGFFFTLSDFTILIGQECSGLRSFFALVITSLVAGHWFLRSGLAKTALVVIVVPLAIIKNAIRIVGLALLANYVDPSYITDSVLHRNGGIPLFLSSLVVLFGIVLILRRYERRPDSMMIQ
ncbi:MAG: exosortase [Nitrospira sp.]|nr:exosortase [Nitrospira sp.]